jgi:hypothetical protein
VTSRRATVTLPKALKHVGQKVRRDTLPGISNDELHPWTRVTEFHVHASARRCELHGIREQVPDDLLQARGFSTDDDGRVRVDLHLDADVLGHGRRPHRVHRLDERDRAGIWVSIHDSTLRSLSRVSSVSRIPEKAARGTRSREA